MRFLPAAALLQSTSSFLLRSSITEAFVLSPQKLVLTHQQPTAHQFQLLLSSTTPNNLSTTNNWSAHIHKISDNNSHQYPSQIRIMTDNKLSYQLLTAQNATTTTTILQHYSTSPNFTTLSTYEGSSILQRDAEDGEKLQRGIDIAKAKGVIDPNFVPEEYITVDVLGKSPDGVADEILGRVRSSSSSSAQEGSSSGGVVVLCGLSGTGKGTTVATLQQKLQTEDQKQVVCWSNGNIFRSVTLLAATWCELHPEESGGDITKALTKENLASFMSMLSFGKCPTNNNQYDTRICGLGLDYWVSQVQNTELKSPKVSKNIPTVAEVTQGEVILFAAEAIRVMGEDGIFVLLEGREQTVNYVRTPLRFTLTLSDMSLIGKRRAAQRLAAAVLAEVEVGASGEEIERVMDGELERMVKEAGL